VAFSSLVSTSAAGSIAAYGLVGIGRAFITRTSFRPGFWDMGWFGAVAAAVTFIWNTFAFAVLCAPQYSNAAIDAESGLFNYAIVIMGGVTIIALFEWWRKSKDDWFQHLKGSDSSSGTDTPIDQNATINASAKEVVV
jgi:hypothetical protein